MKKIRTYFLVWSVTVILLSTMFTGLFLFKVTSKTLENESKSALSALTAFKAKEYEDSFSAITNSVDAISYVVENTLDLDKCKKIASTASAYDKNSIPYLSYYLNNTITPLISKMSQKTPSVLGGYLTIDPAFIKHKYILGSWLTRHSLEGPLHYQDAGVAADYYPLDRPTMEWFAKPLMTGKSFWSNVYIDNDIKVEMISYSTPIYIQKKIIGVVGMDISLEQIKKSVSAIKIYETGYAALLDKNLRFIFSPQNKAGEKLDEVDNGQYKYLAAEMRLNAGSIVDVKQKSKDLFVSYARLSNGFILMTIVPKTEVLVALKNLKLVFSLILLSVLSVSAGLALKIAKNISEPMEALTVASGKIAHGDFNVKIPNNKEFEEIDNLSRSLKKFSDIYQQHWDNENLLNIIMSNIPDGILIINKCAIESCNKAMTNIFGYAENEILGESLHKFLDQSDLMCENEFLGPHCLLSKTLVSNTEVLGINKYGKKVYLELLGIELVIKSQKRLMLIVKDISKQKEIDTLKNNFISMISHELRTPLTSIRGALGLVSSGVLGVLPDKVKELVNIAGNNAVRLVNLINDILDLEKIKAGKMDFNFDEYEIMPLVEETIDFNKDYGKQYNVEYRIVERLDKTLVNVDKDRFIQILTNLLSNAAKFSDPNEIVDIAVEKLNHSIRLSVVNKGLGIPKESYAKVFESFSQVDSSDGRSKGGTGLGLSISKSIIQKMGGTIGFTSSVNDKTTFYFEFPEIYQKNIKERVLICEDEPTTAFCIKKMFEKIGYYADVAHSASETRKLLNLKDYNLMTLDLILPDKDGLDLLDEIRNNDKTKSLPVIIISARKEDYSSIKARHDIVDWLEKTFDSKALESTINKIMIQKNKDKINILHVEHDEDVLEIISSTMKDVANITKVKTLADAEKIVNEIVFDIIIFDYKFPNGTCESLVHSLQNTPNKNSNVIIFSAYEITQSLSEQVDLIICKTKVSNDEFMACVEPFISKTAKEKGIINQ